MTSFMVFISVLGLLMFKSSKDALVDDDYYETGINYNKVYNRKEQALIDHAIPEIAANQELIIVRFKNRAKGTARLMRTSDKSLDQTIPFESDTNHQLVIPAKELKKGAWKLILEWVSNERSYLYEKEIIL